MLPAPFPDLGNQNLAFSNLKTYNACQRQREAREPIYYFKLILFININHIIEDLSSPKPMISPEVQPFAPEKAFFAVFLSWFVAQALKVILGGTMKKKFDFRWLFDTGGMPSAHSATVSSLATATGLYYGFNTLPFLIVLIVCLITMFDAAGVRRHFGRQATILNQMLDDFYSKGFTPERRVKELLGHTPFEVFAGALTGVLVATLFCG